MKSDRVSSATFLFCYAPFPTFNLQSRMAATATQSSYDADAIVALEGLEPVRKRPGMYIGGVGTAGLHHLIWEIVDNSVDEAMNGHASEIIVTLHKDGQTITVGENGRGRRVDGVSGRRSGLGSGGGLGRAGGRWWRIRAVHAVYNLQPVRFVVPFPGLMMIHCHILKHEDRGMMVLANSTVRVSAFVKNHKNE